MKTNTMRKSAAFVICTAMLTASTVVSFAAVSGAETVPVHINVPATAVDFTVTEKISMTGKANAGDLTIDSLEVTNNNEIGVLKIESIKASSSNGWILSDNSADFLRMEKDSKKFSIVADDSHDLVTEYKEAGTVDPGQTDTTVFSGKTCIVSEPITDEKVADVVVTVSII
ncbi:MAG: hypothetical protein DBY08_00050 [Clostridiales bacterium]|nr:hypothetical protein [Bacillota bacterium]MEE0516594.1 hypothetical protein [Anaerovoracaceae bacterium]PWL95256.1 MAG: hypothetical protein DBY08_00050 [Clostridiales bacterium]